MNKIIPILVAFVLSITGYLFLKDLTGRYTISLDGQSYERCLPFWLYVFDSEFEAGEITVGTIVKIKPSFDRDERITKKHTLAKVVLASEGDQIRVANGELFINGEFFSKLYLLDALNKSKEAYETTYIIPKGKLFVGGTSPGSYDSRYWGLVDNSEVKGVGYAVL